MNRLLKFALLLLLPVLGFAFLVSLVTGILFGTGPAWLSSHARPADAFDARP